MSEDQIKEAIEKMKRDAHIGAFKAKVADPETKQTWKLQMAMFAAVGAAIDQGASKNEILSILTTACPAIISTSFIECLEIVLGKDAELLMKGNAGKAEIVNNCAVAAVQSIDMHQKFAKRFFDTCRSIIKK